MRVLLISPPVRDYYESSERLTPLGLCYLKAALGRYSPKAKVKVLDARAGGGAKSVAAPPELAELHRFYRQRDAGPFSTFHAYRHFGMEYESVADEAEAFAPDLIGVPLLFSAYHAEALELCAALKRRLPRALIVVGGPHASALGARMLKNPQLDFVIRGEGEKPLSSLVNALAAGGSDLSSVPNLIWRRESGIVENRLEENFPLEEIPAPDFSNLDPTRYRIGKKPLATLLASRGCPRGCAFCSVEEIFGNRHRARTPEDILAEIRLRHVKGYRAFDFEDDNLALKRGDFLALLAGITAEYGEKGISLAAMNGIDYLTLDGEILDAMARAGFAHLNLSLVSLDIASCRAHNRASSPEKFAAVARQGAARGLLVNAYLILGLPGENLETMVAGLKFLAELPVLIGVSPFYLTPGMALWSGEPTRKRLMNARLTALGPDTPECPREAVYTLFIASRMVNFLKGLELGGEKATLKDALEVASTIPGKSAKGAEILRALLETGVFSKWDGKAIFADENFDSRLFAGFWGTLEGIGTRSGGTILLP